MDGIVIYRAACLQEGGKAVNTMHLAAREDATIGEIVEKLQADSAHTPETFDGELAFSKPIPPCLVPDKSKILVLQYGTGNEAYADFQTLVADNNKELMPGR